MKLFQVDDCLRIEMLGINSGWVEDKVKQKQKKKKTRRRRYRGDLLFWLGQLAGCWAAAAPALGLEALHAPTRYDYTSTIFPPTIISFNGSSTGPNCH